MKMNNLENKKYWIWFSLIENLGSARGKILLEKFKETRKNLLRKKRGIKEYKRNRRKDNRKYNE